MEFRPRKHNTPVATLLKNYEDKKSGKVVESRKEIQWRFEYLDWKDQKKILNAFLASGKSDREWAAAKMTSFWDRSFEPVIKKMWEETQDGILAWPIIRYFPVDYLKSNIDRLGKGRSYYFLCLRLADEKDFEMDESRLRETDLLKVCCNSSRVLSKEKALDCLYTIVYNLCTWRYPYDMGMADTKKGYMLSILKNPMITDAFNSLKQLGMHDVITEFAIWHVDVCEDLLNSDEFAKLYAGRLKDTDYNRHRLVLTKKYYFEHLAPQYKPADEGFHFALQDNDFIPDDNYWGSKDQPWNFDVDKSELKRYDIIRERALDEVYTLPDYILRNDAWEKKVLERMKDKNPALSGLINKFELTLPE